MYRILTLIACLLVFGLSSTAYAQQSGGDDLAGVCSLSGGTWTGSEGGNWACCWADWGCYGCHNGLCKMQCRTKRCRDANRINRGSPGTKAIKQLAPAGTVAPIAPVTKPKAVSPPQSSLFGDD